MESKINNTFIAIEGNIGSGKTTVAKLLAQTLNANLILEEFEENPFLELFYKNKSRYAFQVELFFLADRFEQLKSKMSAQNLFSQITIADYHIDKCYIFARNNLDSLEYKLYQNLFSIIKQSLPAPSTILYLHSDEEKLLSNIKKRGRPYELAIPVDYLRSLHQSYMTHFKQQPDKRILLLDNSEIDFTEGKDALNDLIALLSKEFSPGIHKICL